MSDMQRNRGIIKRISTKESAREVFDKLVTDGIIDPKWCEMLDESIPKADKEYEDRSKGTFWAVKLKNGNYMARNTSAAPALYTTRNRAISTIEKNWPGIVDIGYELVKFGEI